MTATVACCQVALEFGDLEGNRARVSAAVTAAALTGADIVVLPELANSGYVFRDADEARSLAEPAAGPTVSGWVKLASQLGVVLVGGFCERGEGVLHNSAVLIDETGLRVLYRKAHLWDRETLLFTPGDAAPPVVDTSVGRIGVLLCYDLEFPEWVRLAALTGADLLCAPVNWPSLRRPEGERPAEVVRVQAAASTNRMFIAACARAGTERGVAWVTNSVIVDPDGWPLALAASDGEDLIVASCELTDARHKGISEHNDVHADRRPALYRTLLP